MIKNTETPKEVKAQEVDPLGSSEPTGYLPNGKPADPFEILEEIEAYLTFRLMIDEPNVPVDDMRQMKKDIADVLRANGIDVNYQADNGCISGQPKK